MDKRELKLDSISVRLFPKLRAAVKTSAGNMLPCVETGSRRRELSSLKLFRAYCNRNLSRISRCSRGL